MKICSHTFRVTYTWFDDNFTNDHEFKTFIESGPHGVVYDKPPHYFKEDEYLITPSGSFSSVFEAWSFLVSSFPPSVVVLPLLLNDGKLVLIDGVLALKLKDGKDIKALVSSMGLDMWEVLDDVHFIYPPNVSSFFYPKELRAFLEPWTDYYQWVMYDYVSGDPLTILDIKKDLEPESEETFLLKLI